jgi:triacylglycerol lipase
MKNIDELFNTCNTIKYTNIGEDVSYAFMEEGDTLYIYFEPSNGKTDWKHNFMFRKKPYKDMKVPYRVHTGFLECWKTVEDIIIDKICELETFEGASEYRYKNIVITGYSHGGALAVLCHECCWFHRPDIRDSIFGFSFDGPRVIASFKVKKELKPRWKNFITFRNNTDLVTHVPPKIFGYSHVGRLIKVGKGKRYGFLTFIKSHYPTNISKSIEEFIECHNIKSLDMLF